MKKFVISVCTSILLLSISACSLTSSTQQVSSATAINATSSTNNGRYLSTSFTNASPVQIQLAVGTLKLQGTQYEVDAQTAAELLPLWKAVYSLGNSDTTSQVEMQAIYKQIQETMSAEQITDIAEMKITSEVMAQVVQESGLAPGAPSTGEQAVTGTTSQAGGAMPAGDPGMGGPPDSMGVGMGMGGEQSQTSAAGKAGSLRSTSIEQTLVSAVIDLLEAKAL